MKYVKMFTNLQNIDKTHLKDTIWALARLDVSQQQVNVYPLSQSMPYWNASNTILTEKVIPLKILAFLPVLPYPVTEYTTVYSTMRKSVALLSQLLQKRNTYVL